MPKPATGQTHASGPRLRVVIEPDVAIGPGKAAYSSAIVPIIAMALSTAFEGFQWTPLSIAGAALAIGGMVLAMWTRARPPAEASPDAA